MIDKLKIISTEQILTFEAHSLDHAAKLAHEIEREGKLKNPILVYPLYDRYLMLDDACVLKALEYLEVKHVPVQVADEKAISVHPWQRVVENWRRRDLVEFCGHFPRQIKIHDTMAGELGANQAEVHFRNEAPARLIFTSDSFLVRADIYAKFSADIIRGNRSYRAMLDIKSPDPLAGFANGTAALFPPVFSLDELAGIAIRDIPLPQGMVRIDQPGRVLGIDYALAILQEHAPRDEKETFLKELIRMRMSSDRTAYYYGNVFMFNN